MIERIGRDNHTPLYFLLLRAWAAAFGTSAIALRSMSVFLGGLTIVGIYLLMSEAYRDGKGEKEDAEIMRRPRALLATAFVALSAFQIRWSWEVRMYTLGTALAVFSSWAMFRALRRPTDPSRHWLLYGLLALLFAYTHYYAIFSIVAQALFVFGYLLVSAQGRIAALLTSASFRWAGMAFNMLSIGCLAWLPTFLRQRSQVQADFWTRPVTGSDIANVCYQMLLQPENAVNARTLPFIVAILCLAVVLSLLVRARAADLYLCTATVLPFVLSTIVSVADTKVFHLRYFLFGNLFFLASLAALCCRVPHMLARRLLYGGTLAALMAIHCTFWQKLAITDKPGARACTSFLADHRRSEEPVIVCSPLLYYSVLYHAQDRTGWFLYSDRRDVVHYEGAAVVDTKDVIRDVQLQAISSERVWVIDMTGWGGREVPVPRTWSLLSVRRFPEVYYVQGEILLREYATSGPTR